MREFFHRVLCDGTEAYCFECAEWMGPYYCYDERHELLLDWEGDEHWQG